MLFPPPPLCRSAVMVRAQHTGVQCCDVQAQPVCALGALGRKQGAGLWLGNVLEQGAAALQNAVLEDTLSFTGSRRR